jgi:hypothetical protein
MISYVTAAVVIALIIASLAYTSRWLIIRSFIFQCESVEHAKSLKLLFNGLPDAVLLLTKEKPTATD